MVNTNENYYKLLTVVYASLAHLSLLCSVVTGPLNAKKVFFWPGVFATQCTRKKMHSQLQLLS
jgi:hypothetical protein